MSEIRPNGDITNYLQKRTSFTLTCVITTRNAVKYAEILTFHCTTYDSYAGEGAEMVLEMRISKQECWDELKNHPRLYIRGGL